MASYDKQFNAKLREAVKSGKISIAGLERFNEVCSELQSKKLNKPTTDFVSKENGITEAQSQELFDKMVSFNKILIDKYGDKYLENVNHIMSLVQEYKMKLITKYIAKNKKEDKLLIEAFYKFQNND